MRKTRLPDFLIIAAPKAGTTSLYHYLQAHPQVWMPRLKEPNWFVFDGPETPRFGGPHDAIRHREMIKSWDAYRALFAECPPDKVCGEASIRYVYHSQARQAIRRRLPDVRLIALLRQPADRAYSAYQRDRSHGLESCPTFAEAIADGPRREREGWRRGAYQGLGYYARALAPWFETFDRSQLRVDLYDDLVADPAALICDIYRFIGVDDGFQPDMTQRYNVTGTIRNPLWRLAWRGSRRLRSHLMPWVPMRLRGRFFELAARLPIKREAREPMDPDLRAQLTEAYRDDIQALSRLIGRNLDAWLEPQTSGRAHINAQPNTTLAR